MTTSIERAAGKFPWPSRKFKVWWRGASGWMWPAAAPRVLTLARWHKKAWADLAFTSPWRMQLRQWRKDRVSWLNALPHDVSKIPGGTEMRTTMEHVARYRYALHLPGSYGATYSRTLQFLVWTGATIFIYDCPYYEFYYHHLGEGSHFVAVNASDLGEAVGRMQKAPLAAAGIGAAALAFARARLTAGHFALYWKQLLDAYARLQRFSPALPSDACTCWPAKTARERRRRPRHLPRGTVRCPTICDFGS